MAELADAHGSGYTTSVNLQNHVFYLQKIKYADMAELADAHGSGPCESNFMEVQVLLSALGKSPDAAASGLFRCNPPFRGRNLAFGKVKYAASLRMESLRAVIIWIWKSLVP